MPSKMSAWTLAATGTAFLLTFGFGVTAASAAEVASHDVVVAGEKATKTDPGSGLKTTVSLGNPTVTSAADVASDESLSSEDKREILASSMRATIRSNHWSQFTTGGAYTQTQNGRFYYNGSKVWVTQNISGKKGSHSCFTNYVLNPWSISNVSKSDSGSSTSRSLLCRWSVKQAFVLTTSASMTARISKSGGISGFGSSLG